LNIEKFVNEKFGSIRVIIEDGTEWFVAKDIASCLGYVRERDAIKDHVDDEYKKNVNLNSAVNHRAIRGNPNTILINEAGVYQLIFGSKLPDAKEFQKWVFEEVLPSIRNVGGYLDLDRPEVRALTIDVRTRLTEMFDYFTFFCEWISVEQSDQAIRSLTRIANNLAGIHTGGRNDANTEQLLKLSIIESSFSKTISKRLKKYISFREKFSLAKLIVKCENNAIDALNKAGYKTKDVFITTEW